MIVVLPWPDKRLSPNSRAHWADKVRPKAYARLDAKIATMGAAGFHAAKEAFAQSDGPIPFKVTFYPPDKRHRDDDNMIGSIKSARDGVAQALNVNDRRFRSSYTIAEPCKPGRVEIEMLPLHGVEN